MFTSYKMRKRDLVSSGYQRFIPDVISNTQNSLLVIGSTRTFNDTRSTQPQQVCYFPSVQFLSFRICDYQCRGGFTTCGRYHTVCTVYSSGLCISICSDQPLFISICAERLLTFKKGGDNKRIKEYQGKKTDLEISVYLCRELKQAAVLQRLADTLCVGVAGPGE